MAKYISLKVEPVGGTAFDYLINVEGVTSFYAANDLGVLAANFLIGGTSVSFPLDITSADADDFENFTGVVNGLMEDAWLRSGNESFVPAEDGPITITSFS